MRMRVVVALGLAGVVVALDRPLTATEPASPEYVLEDLGDFGPDAYPYVTGINRHGDVVGWVQSLTDFTQVRAWRRRHDAAAPEILRGNRSWALAINDAGVIVGFDVLPDNRSVGFRYSDDEGFTEIEALRGFQSAPAAINNAGGIAGVYLPSAEVGPRAFRITGSTFEDLGVLFKGTASWGAAMNDAGQVAGYAYGSGWAFRMAFRHTPGSGLQNLGTLGGSDSEATAINARGQVAGTAVTGYTPYPHFHAFRYTDGQGMQDLAPHLLTSSGVAMNSAGDVVGRALFVPDAYSPDHDLYDAFLYADAAGIVNLNDVIPASSGWILHTGTGINDAGQIVGTGELNGQRKVFKLTRKDTEPPVIAAEASRSMLWPPDGQMVPVSFTVSATDNVDPQPVCRMASVTSNEAGSGQFVISGPFSARFAAAREGTGTGRVYTVTFQCSDRTGNTAVRSLVVTVPHSQ